MLGIIAGIGYSVYAIMGKDKNVDGKRFFTMVDDKGVLYTVNDLKEPLKLSEKPYLFPQVEYIESIKGNIFLDKEQNLVLIDKKGDSKNLASNVVMYNVKENLKGSAIYYLDKDKNLYKVDLKNGVPVKIESGVLGFSVTKNNTIIYETKDYKEGFYVKGENKVIEKVTGKFHRTYTEEEDNKIAVYEDNKYYVYDIDKKSKEEIPKGEKEFLISVEPIKGGYLFKTIAEEDYEKGIKLSFKEKDKEPTELVYINESLVLNNKKAMYYSTKEEGKPCLYYRDFNKKEAAKLYEGDNENCRFIFTQKQVYVLNNEELEYKIAPDGKKERIYKDIKNNNRSDIKVYKYDIAYITGNDDLYIGEHKVAEAVKKFQVIKDSLVYISNNNEVYFLKNNKKPELVIKNAKDYNKIYFRNILIFEKVFDEEELYGAWQQENKPKVMINFQRKLMNIVTEQSNVEFKYSVENTLSNNEMTINIENENKQLDKDLRIVSKVDKDTIKINEVSYKKIDKEVFEEYAKQEKKALDNIKKYTGAVYMNIDIKCTAVQAIGNNQYFLYESKDDKNHSTGLIDEDGIGYIYNYDNWSFHKKFEKDSSYNKYYVDREENKAVAYDENRIIDMSKVKSNHLEKINPTYMDWEKILEVAAKDFFKSRPDLKEEDVFFKGELMDGSYYVEVMHNEKFVCEYEISPLDGAMSRKR